MSEIDGPPHDLPRLIEVLDRYEVEYLIVGGAAAFAYGAERPTDDADCVVRRERANLARLAGALRELHARLRVGGMTDVEARALPVQIDDTTLDMAGMSTWMTDAGPFDVLAGLEAPDGRLVPYEELVVRAALLYGNGFTIRAAALEDIIRAKERADRAKDREALPELRALRDASAGGDARQILSRRIESPEEWVLRAMALFDPAEAALGRYLSAGSPGPAGLSALDEIVTTCNTARTWMEDNACPYPTIGSLLLEHNDVYLAIVEELRLAGAGAGADHDLEATARRLAALVETKERLDDAIEKWTPDG